MSLGRISTYAVFNNTLRNVNNTQSSLFGLQDQISSGLKTRNFEGLNGQVEQFVQLEGKIDKTKAYEQNNAVAISRLRTTDQALSQVVDVTDDIENLMVLRRNASFADKIAFEEQITAKMEAIASELNVKFDGRYLFGGTRTNTQPVITDPQIPMPLENGTLDTGYYQGSKEDIMLRADDQVLLNTSVRADNEAFQKIFGAVALALEGHTEEDDEILKQAIDMIQSAQADLTAVQATVNTNIITLTDINERHENLRLYWQGVTEEVSKTDILAASTQVAVDEAVLQASFQAFAGINQLRLVDFL